MTRFALTLALAVAAAACSDLPPLGDATCGNGVVDPGEDCDGPAPACVACRVHCDAATPCAAAVPAPRDASQYRCGTDELCHAAAGTFVEEAAQQFPVVGFGITDVDGDAIGDVVGLSPSSLVTRFGSATSTPLARALESLTPTLTGPPSIAHLDADPSLDFVVPSADGAVAYTSTNRVVAPLAYAIEYHGIGTGDAMQLVPQATFPVDATHIGIVFLATAAGAQPQLIGGIVDMTVAGTLPQLFALCAADYEPQTFGQRELTSYALGDARGTVFAVRGTRAGEPELCAIELSPGARPTDPFAVATLAQLPISPLVVGGAFANLDPSPAACPALVLSVAASATDARATATIFGGGAGAAGGCALTTSPDPAHRTLALDGAAVIGRVPLALAGAPAYATDAVVTSAGGIFAFRALGTTAFEVLYQSDRAIDQVAFGDIDADGGIDAVLASNREANIDILYRDVPDPAQSPELPTWRRVRQGTAGVPLHVVTGDFDGNHADDVLYFEQPAAFESHLQVAYGSPAGAAPPVEVGELAQVVAAIPVQLADSNDPFRRVRDLAVAELRPGDATPVVGLLHGATERAMIPYIDPRATGGSVGTFAAAGAGYYFQTPGADFVGPDLAFVGLDFTAPPGANASLWVMRAAGVGAFEVVLDGDSHASSFRVPLHGWGFCGADPLAATFCLDGAYVLPWRVGAHDVYVAFDIVHGQAAVIDLAAMAIAPVLSATGVTAAGSAATGAGIRVTAAPLGGATVMVATSAAGARTCSVGADLALACRDLADQPGARCTDAGVGRVGAGANTDALVLLCDRDRLVRFTAADAPETIYQLPRGGEFTMLAVGDVTGDAVDDLVLGDGRTVSVFRQRTTSEAAE